jgi:hypothetical protein
MSDLYDIYELQSLHGKLSLLDPLGIAASNSPIREALRP